jgi:predicted lipase
MLQRFIDCLEQKYIHVENDGSYMLKRDENKLIIYFEWSNGKNDWKNNFNFPAKPYRDMKNLWFCHRGFLKVWKSIESHIKDDICDPTVTEIEVIGYSHGGAIAQLCFEYIKFNRPDVTVTGYGYGAPRVFWGFARKSVKKRFEGFTVIRNGRDIVTRMPPVLFGFRHICTVKKVGVQSAGPILDHYQSAYIAALDWSAQV